MCYPDMFKGFRFSSIIIHVTNPSIGLAFVLESVCSISKFVRKGKLSEVSDSKIEADNGCSVKKMLSINEWELVDTRVGIVVKGYMFKADIIVSRSIALYDRGRVRLMLKSLIKMASFPCPFR